MSVEVVQQYSNTVRVTLVGETEVPSVEVNSTDQGIAVTVNPEIMAQDESPEAEVPPPAPTETTETQELIELVVTATRTEEETREVPRSVTVIEREEIEQQSIFTNNVGDILGKTLPGFGPPNQRDSTLGQSLRGRDFSVLIDGVPQSLNRDIRVDFDTIDPSAIERIEVVRGPTAVYGADATGGVINIITRQPEEGEFNASSKVGIDFSFDSFDESASYVLEQNFSGKLSAIDYQVTASFESTGAIFDAEGDRIGRFFPQNNLDERETLNFLGKFGWDINSEQRLQLTANYFETEQNPEVQVFTANPDGGKAIPEPIGDIEIENSSGVENLVLTLDYSHENLLGSNVQGQLFYRDIESLGFPFEQSSFFLNVVGRSNTQSETWGGRLEVETPLNDDDSLNVFWGIDYSEENTEQSTDIFDRDIFDNSDGTRFVFDRKGVRVPPFELNNFGAFAQLNWEASDAVIVRGGLRYTDIHFSTDDFTTFWGASAEGGEQNLDDVVFNLGTTVDVSDNINVFANFAQGFTAPDFGRIIRFPDFNGIENVGDDLEVTQPQKVDSYEIGVRGNWDNFQGSLAGFFTYSDLGLTLIQAEPGQPFQIDRSPKRTYGLEGSLDWQPTDNWQFGGTLTLIEGEDNQDDDDNFEALSVSDIQPLKLTAYIQNQTTPDWSNRLQFLIVGDRSVDNSSVSQEIDGYVAVDLISQLDLGNGSLTLGVENLFDNLFFPPIDQEAIQTEGFAIPAPGRTFSINYRVDF